MSGVTVLAIVSEIYPLIKTGAPPAALAAQGVAVTTLVPGYPAVMDAIETAEPAFASGVGTGVQFSHIMVQILGAAIERVDRLWTRPRLWRHLIENGMKMDVSWRRPAAAHADLLPGAHRKPPLRA